MLLTTIDEFKKYVPVNKATFWASVQPILEDVEREYIDFAFGTAFKAQVQAVYNISLPPFNITPIPVFAELITLTQRALCNLGMWKLIPTINVQISDAGIRSAQTPDAEQARMWQIRDLSDMHRDRGLFNLNELYKHLEANIQLLGVWTLAPSPGYTLVKNHLLRNTDDVQAHININGNRFIFQKMIPMIENVEMEYIIPTISQSLFNYFIAGFNINNSAFSSYELYVYKLAQKATALLTYAEMLPHHAVNLEEQGITVLSNMQGENRNRAANDNAGRRQAIDWLYTQNRTWGLQVLSKISEYINNNLDNLPNYIPDVQNSNSNDCCLKCENNCTQYSNSRKILR